MSVCKRYIKVAYAVTGHRQALLTRLRCKQWSCDYCADKNARSWQYWLIKRLPELSNEWYLVTLTANSKTRTTLASLENLRSNIDRLIKRMRRVFGDEIEYVRVYEKHPTSQAIHVHFIMCGLSPYVAVGCSKNLQPMAIGVLTREARNGIWALKTWIKKTCGEIKMGYIADAKLLKGDAVNAAFYVTKYLTKDMQSIDVPYLRHVQVTKNIGSPEFEKKYNWVPVSYITAETVGHKTIVTDIDTGFVIEGDNFWEHTGFYPNND